MVRQCLNLYENAASRGTLFVSFDDTKYLIKFYDSIKVEVLLEEEDACNDADDSNFQKSATTSAKDTEGFRRWGDYIDLLQISSDQGMSETLQKIVKPEDGQSLTITTLNPASRSGDDGSRKICDDRIEVVGDRIYVDDVAQTIPRRTHADGNDCQRVVGGDHVVQNGTVMILKTEDSQNSNDMESFQEVTVEELDQNEVDRISTEKGLLTKKDTVTGGLMDKPTGTKRKTPTAHECRDCFTNFVTTQALKDHRKVMNNDEYQCDECSEIFQLRAFFEVHKKSNHGSAGPSLVYKDNRYWYSCDSCGVLVESLVKLQNHNMTHTGEGLYQCCRCPQKFGEKQDFAEHMKSHKSIGGVNCRWCNQWFDTKAALGKHKISCKVIKCHMCDTVFPNRTSRNQHYKDFHPNDILKCKLCPYMFSSQQEMNDHMAKHSKFKKKQCPLCGLFFSRLKKHMLVHKNPDELAESEIYYCDKCPAKFTNQATFSRHWKSHSGDKPYQCPNCPRTFSNCGVLYKHIKRHKSLLPYTCEVCSQTCASIDDLKSHMKTHSDDNLLFPCSICTQAFMYKNSLEAHIQMKHSNQYSTASANPHPTSGSSGLVKSSQDFNGSNVSHFSDNANGLMEVVIQGITGLIDSPGQKYEVVLHK